MEVISFIVLILLSLVGYSAGVVGKSGKFIEFKPQIIDLILVSTIWAGAIYSRLDLKLDKWLLILLWLILSSVIGILSICPRIASKEKISSSKDPKKNPTDLLKKLWQSWKDFSRRMGSFQSRILLSLVFFIFVSPFALAVKMFSDPLKIKHQSNKSHWHPKKEIKTDLEQSRKQF